MDEALCRVAVDLGGRPYLVYDLATTERKIRDFDLWLLKHFFESLVQKARMNLHIKQLYGEEPHHIAEAIFKAFARALDQATAVDPRMGDALPSTKGTLSA